MAGTAAEKAGTLAEQAKAVASDVADKHGDTVTGAVSSASALVSEKTGGKLDSVTGAVESATAKAVDALKPSQPGPEPTAEDAGTT